MSPNQTWHWRMCFIPTGGSTICGADQTFRTPAAPETVPPETVITSGPSGLVATRTATFTFNSNEDGVHFECKLDGATSFTGCPLGEPTYANLAQGSHTLRVRAIDQQNNVDPTPAVRTWRVDTIKPNTTILSGPPATTTSRRARITFTSSESGSRFLCSLDGRRFQACSSPKVYTALPLGSHNVRVKAKDAAGNVDGTPAKRSWRIIRG